MKKSITILSLAVLGLMVIFSSCKKDYDKDLSDEMLKNLEADIEFVGDGKFDKVITKPLVKLDDCKYIVEGTIEFQLDGIVVAVIDFGDGTCDNIATKTVDGETTEFSLDKTGDDYTFKKVIVEPLVKIEGCDYIVSGIIKFYKEDKWIATLDFGDGECDEWATKYWEGGNKVISLSKN